MHVFKFLLLLGSGVVWLLIGVMLYFQIAEAWSAPYRWIARGVVIEVRPAPAGDAERIPSSGPSVVVEFKDARGDTRREAYTSFNSAGRTPFYGKNVGDPVEFELVIDRPAPGAKRRFDWQNTGKAHWALGGTLVVIGLLLYVL